MNVNTPEPTQHTFSLSTKKSRRTPVTKADVKAALEELAKEGRGQTLENLLAQVGGSKTTILKHLEDLRTEEKSFHPSEPSAVSPYVLRALATDIERAVKEKSSELVARLQESRKALKILVQECEELQASAYEKDELLEASSNSLAEQVGVNKSLREELSTRAQQVADSRTDAEKSRQSLAVCEARLRAAEERRDVLEHELKECAQTMAGAKLEVEAAKGAASALQAELAAKHMFLEHLQSSAVGAERFRQALEESLQQRASLEAERAALLERHVETKSSLAASEARVQQLLSKLLLKHQQLPSDASEGE